MEATGAHILVIDDDPAIRDVISQLLTDEGYRVSVSTTYFDDLDVLLDLAPDLIVLDLVMGGKLAGIDFLDTIKSDPRTAAIPVAVCTAASHLNDEINARLTAWDCLIIRKPFDLDDFLAEINRCLHQRDPQPAGA